MTEINPPHGMALACQPCGQRFPDGISMGVVAARIEVEHDTQDIRLDMVVICHRCDVPMDHEHTVGNRLHYRCATCKRTRVYTQGRKT